MSKSDDALAAAQEVRRQAFLTGRPANQLVEEIAIDWGLNPPVVASWVLRDPNFESLEMLDEAVANSHREAAEFETRTRERAQQREIKFRELAEIIDSIPSQGVFWAMLNVVGSSKSQSWRDWIQKNSWEPEIEREAAYAFATSRLRDRLTNEKPDNAPNK